MAQINTKLVIFMFLFVVAVPIVIIVILFVIMPYSSVNNSKKYDGFSYMEITVQSRQVTDFHVLLEKFPELVFWQRTRTAEILRVMVPALIVEDFEKELNVVGFKYKVDIEDIGKFIRHDENDSEVDPTGTGYFGKYLEFDKMKTFLNEAVVNNTEIANLKTIGNTYEKRTLLLLKISNSDNHKPAIWIQGGLHAEEKIGPMVVLYIIYQLLSNYIDPEGRTLVDNFDWYFVPVVNVDGYAYSSVTDRLWRKSRSLNKQQPGCTGVDLNRNYDAYWSATQNHSCSEFYEGPHSFSEPETQTVSQYILDNLVGRLRLSLDFHSFYQAWLLPFAATEERPRNFDEMQRLALIASSAAKKVNGMDYEVLPFTKLFNSPGTAVDWMYLVAKANFSYQVELRDTGKYGYLLPKAQIYPTASETWAAVKALVEELIRMMPPSTEV